MSNVLHRGIRDGLRDSPAYAERGILVSLLLEATADLAADETLLYRAVYTIFRALPERLLPGSVLLIATEDIPGGIQLVWEGREAEPASRAPGDVRGLLRSGPFGDLLEIAVGALERFCEARAGFVETTVKPIADSSAFPRPPHVVRRVMAFLPSPTSAISSGQGIRAARAAGESFGPRPRGEGGEFRAARALPLTRIRHA